MATEEHTLEERVHLRRAQEVYDICIEAVRNLQTSLAELGAWTGEINGELTKELSDLYEEHYPGTELIDYLAAHVKKNVVSRIQSITEETVLAEEASKK